MSLSERFLLFSWHYNPHVWKFPPNSAASHPRRLVYLQQHHCESRRSHNKFGEQLINCEVLRKDPVPYVSCCSKVTLLIHIITTLVTLSGHVNTFQLLAVYFMHSFF
jgi:hypothetical protein